MSSSCGNIHFIQGMETFTKIGQKFTKGVSKSCSLIVGLSVTNSEFANRGITRALIGGGGGWRGEYSYIRVLPD